MNLVLKQIEGLTKQFKYAKLPELLSKKFREIYKNDIPKGLKIEGDDKCLYSKQGVLICKGYKRIVIGDYGAYIEFTKEQANEIHYKIEKGQEYRLREPYINNIKYIWLTTRDTSKTKIYAQLRTVTYADYKPNHYYISPYEVIIN